VDFNIFIQNLQCALVVSELELRRTFMRRNRPVLAFFWVERRNQQD
jgi:hypothetical protein